MIKGQEETQREEISTKIEKVEMTQEVDHIIEDIIGHRKTDEGIFHKT